MYQKYCNSNTLASNCKVASYTQLQCVIINEVGIFNCTSLGFIYVWLCSPQASNNYNNNYNNQRCTCVVAVDASRVCSQV